MLWEWIGKDFKLLIVVLVSNYEYYWVVEDICLGFSLVGCDMLSECEILMKESK